MFERYTENARKAVFFARFEASRFGQPHIEPEHLLLGVLMADSELAIRLLHAPEKIEAVRAEVEKRHPVIQSGAQTGDLPVSADTRRALKVAHQESEKRGQAHIGCEHLLLGLWREKTAAAEILKEQGITHEALESEAQRSMADALPAKTRGLDPVGRVRAAVKAALERRGSPLDAPEPNRALLTLRNLSEEARGGKLRPLIGRERELERTIEVLARKVRNNAVLVGEPGVGKNAILAGMAQRIVDLKVPPSLAERPVFAIHASSLIAPSRRAESEETGSGVLALLAGETIGILCVNGLLDMAARPGWGATEAVYVMEVLSRSGIQCVATGTPAGLRRALENAGVLVRQFEVVEVPPASEEDALAVLEGLKPEYEEFHKVTYEDGVLEAAVFASGRFLPHRFLPDRALDLLDDAGSRAQVKKLKTVSKEDLEMAIAERLGVSLTSVQQILGQKKGKDAAVASQRLAAVVPGDQRDWLPFLAAYVAGSSKEEVSRLARAMEELKDD